MALSVSLWLMTSRDDSCMMASFVGGSGIRKVPSAYFQNVRFRENAMEIIKIGIAASAFREHNKKRLGCWLILFRYSRNVQRLRFNSLRYYTEC